MNSPPSYSALEELQALDAGLDNEMDNQVEIDKVLKKKTAYHTTTIRPKSNTRINSANAQKNLNQGNEELYLNISDDQTYGGQPSMLSTPSIVEKTNETADRFSKAKIMMLKKQVDELNELRLKYEEINKDLSKQLKIAKEDTNTANKRIQQLEIEVKKLNRKNERDNGDALSGLEQEVSSLKRELETAQRIAKQNDASSKSKDAQLKKSQETIAKLKAQLLELQQNSTEKSQAQMKTENFEQKVEALTREKATLLSGINKLLKYIEVLKKKNLHLEASRLLAFTEEEFMKTLDWNPNA